MHTLRKSGLRLHSFGLATALLLTGALPSASALAQNELSAALQALECVRIEQDRERLRCYDAALRAPAPAARQPQADAPPAARTPQRREAEPAPPPARAAAAAPAATPATPASPTAAAAPSRAAAARSQPTTETIRVRIVSVRRDNTANATFVTDDGQVWRQTDGRRVNLDEPPFAAEIRPGALGSSFLVPDGKRAIRAHRER